MNPFVRILACLSIVALVACGPQDEVTEAEGDSFAQKSDALWASCQSITTITGCQRYYSCGGDGWRVCQNDTWDGNSFKVRNRTPWRQYVKVAIASWNDTGCHWVEPGELQGFFKTMPGSLYRVDAVRSCN
jgi:hypothetical protein